MASAQDFVADLTCSICLEIFVEPLTLPCMHNFCKGCLKNLVDNRDSRRLKCPECRKDVGGGIDRLPKNFTLTNLANKCRQLGENNAPKVPCSMCEGEPRDAVKTCIECDNMSYCQQCLTQFHPMRGKMKEHTLVDATNTRRPEKEHTEPVSRNTQSEPTRVTASVEWSDQGVDDRDEDEEWETLGVEQDHYSLEGVLHPYVTCDMCNGSIFGVRYKCRECMDYDLCAGCESLGCHSDHDMIKVVKPKHRFKRVIYKIPKGNFLANFIHPRVSCDVCDGDVHGVRYKCLECYDYDLCMNCEARNSHPHHDMRKVVKPKLFKEPPTLDKACEIIETGRVHPHILCDVCNRAVKGSRFKCSVCKDFDLCVVCLVNDHHSEHDMIQIN